MLLQTVRPNIVQSIRAYRVDVENFRKTCRLHRFGGRRVTVAEKHVCVSRVVRPAPDEERRRVRPRVREHLEARRRLPPVLDEAHAQDELDRPRT